MPSIRKTKIFDRFFTSELRRNARVLHRHLFAVSCRPAVNCVETNAGCAPLLCAVERKKIFVAAAYTPAPDEVVNRDTAFHF